MEFWNSFTNTYVLPANGEIRWDIYKVGIFQHVSNLHGHLLQILIPNAMDQPDHMIYVLVFLSLKFCPCKMRYEGWSISSYKNRKSHIVSGWPTFISQRSLLFAQYTSPSDSIIFSSHLTIKILEILQQILCFGENVFVWLKSLSGKPFFHVWN